MLAACVKSISLCTRLHHIHHRRHSPISCACRFGECGRQQKGECALVHDPSKVAVCTHWLAGSCSAGDKCKRQHKVGIKGCWNK
jgi:hypothetical protein